MTLQLVTPDLVSCSYEQWAPSIGVYPLGDTIHGVTNQNSYGHMLILSLGAVTHKSLKCSSIGASQDGINVNKNKNSCYIYLLSKLLYLSLIKDL